MRAMILSEAAFHAAAPESLKLARGGRFPQAFAKLYSDVWLNADEYEAVGAEFEQAMRMKDGRTKGERLNRLGAWAARHLGLNGRASDDPRRQSLVNDIFELARRHGIDRSWEAPPATILVGYVAAAATALAAADVTAETLEDNPEALADCVHFVVRTDHQPFSLTDVRDTIRTMMKHGPIADWICEEEAARLAKLRQGRGSPAAA